MLLRELSAGSLSEIDDDVGFGFGPLTDIAAPPPDVRFTPERLRVASPRHSERRFTLAVLVHRLAKARESGIRIINPTIATTITMTTTFGSLKL
jgi:hypothetical protein